MQFYNQKPVKHLNEIDFNNSVIEICLRKAEEPEEIQIIPVVVPDLVIEEDEKENLEIQGNDIINELYNNSIAEPVAIVEPEPVEATKYLSALDILRLQNKI